MRNSSYVVAMLCGLWACSLQAQVPDDLNGRLLFTLGGSDVGFEDFGVKRRPEGGYHLTAEVDLQIPSLRIVQYVEVNAGERLEFEDARVRAILNDDTTDVTLERKGSQGRQSRTERGSTVTAELETPEGSVLLTNNVIQHIVQFAWLHDGELGERREYVAFPRVPVSVVLEGADLPGLADPADTVRRYFLNLANRVGAYVWLASDGTPLKVAIPLQSFEAVHEAYRGRASVLVMSEGPGTEPIELPYEAEEVRFESDTIHLAGTLTTPSGSGPWPAAVLVSGSGAQDRDENTPGPGGLKLGIFKSIADTLTLRGIAVLRYDDRGVGGSGGDLSVAGLSDLVSDVRSAVRFLRNRPDIDKSQVALVGHSEGGIIAPIVAAEDADIAAIVLMAGTASPLDSVLIEQVVSAAREAGGDSAALAQAREGVEQLTRAIREGVDLDETGLPAGLRLLGGQQKWLREHMQHDPLATLRQVGAPVLIVNGGQDIQVDPQHAYRLAAALREVDHKDFELKIFPQLNHLFAVSRGEGSAEYTDPDARVDPEFLSYLAGWLSGRLAPR